MGSTQSKNKNEEQEEALSLSKHRILFIKHAISTRNAFFSTLCAYAICLKNTGAALTDGTPSDHPSSVDFLPPPPPLSNPNNPPPPPSLPLPKFSPAQPKPVVPTLMEEELELGDEELTTNSSSSRGSVRRSKPQLKAEVTRTHQGSDRDYLIGTDDVVVRGKVQKTVDFALPVRPMVKKFGGKLGRKSRQPVSLKHKFLDIDNHFVKAFESTLEVSWLLETRRLHYHSSFADNRANGHIDHKISHLTSGDQSFKGTQGEDDLNVEETETLATVLDKMLAWENKLYDEVNAGEVIKYEYQKTVSLLNKQKKQGTYPKSLVKLSTAISHLHTRYSVGMQSAESIIAEINCTRDDQLYAMLVQFVDGMATMWKTMLFHHESQAKIVFSLKSLDNSQLQKETSEHQYDCTIQLCGAVRDWHTQFCGLIEYQKDFIRALHNWSKLSLSIPFESNLEEKVSSPPRVQKTQIHALLMAWKNDLDKLPDEVARNALRNLAAVTQMIVHQQEEDMKMRERCKAAQKELARKSTKFQDRCVKNGGDEELEGDEEACQNVRKEAKHKSLASLRYSLVEVFSAMSEVAKACTDMYYNLKRIVEDQHRISLSNPIQE